MANINGFSDLQRNNNNQNNDGYFNQYMNAIQA